MIRPFTMALGMLALANASSAALAASWERAPGVWNNTFKVYTLTRGNDEIRFGLENVSDRTINVGAIRVEYQCSNGSSMQRMHYFSHTYRPGEKRGFVGFDRVCDNSGGFRRWTITDCQSAGQSCF